MSRTSCCAASESNVALDRSAGYADRRVQLFFYRRSALALVGGDAVDRASQKPAEWLALIGHGCLLALAAVHALSIAIGAWQ
jgi:hypothetical protein